MLKHINYKRILLHAAFWLSELIFFTFLFGVSNEKYDAIFIMTLQVMPFEMLLTYFTIYYLIPKFLLKSKYFKFVVLFIVSGVVTIILLRFYTFYVYYPLFAGEENLQIIRQYLEEDFFKTFFFNYSFFNLFVEVYLIVGFASAIKLFKYWMKNQRDKNELAKQNIKSELALLRTQINPHFLFNTLNNIDTLIYQNQAKASDSIIKLSHIMRFMLYETNEEKILLEKELDYLQNYISLLKLRIKNRDFINFEVKGNYAGKRIAPMLLIPFIENAFKHGDKKTEGAKIDITIEIIDNLFNFRISNLIKKTKSKEIQTGGIGLQNVKRRLKLIYKDKAKINISEKDNLFLVELQIQL